MTKTRVIPPSRFQRTLADPSNGTLTIFSATEDGVHLGHDTTYGSKITDYPAGIYIFSEKVTVHVDRQDTSEACAFSSPSSDLTIACSNLEVSPWGSRVVLSTRGEDGVAEIGSNIERKNGQRGHDLYLYIGKFNESFAQQLVLRADGGHGADIVRGTRKTLTGGDGGNAGSLTVAWRSSFSPVLDILASFKRRFDLPKDWSDEDEMSATALSSDHEVFFALKSTVQYILNTVPDPFSELEQHFEPLKELFGSGDEAPVKTIYDFTLALNDCIARFKKASNAANTLLAKASSATGGEPGKADDIGLDRGMTGTLGNRGRVSIDRLQSGGSATTKDPSELNFVFAHPVQCQMLLQKASAYFYFGNPANKEKAQQILIDLTQRLSFLTPELQDQVERKDPRSPLLLAYANYCKSYEATKSFIGSLVKVRTKAINMLIQISSTQVDYYGLPEYWVPRTNYEAFRKALDTSLLQLEKTESMYLTYLNESEQKDKLDKHVKTISGRIDGAVSGIKEELQQINAMLASKYRILADTTKRDAILKAKNDAETGMLRLADEVNAKFEISPRSLINGILNVAGNPTGEMAAAQAGALVYEGLTSVPDASGNPIPKNYIVRSLKKGSENSSKLKEEMLALSGGRDGSVELDEDFSTKLLADAATVEAILDQFADDSFGKVAGQAKSLLKNLANLVLARNADKVEYNLILRTILAKRAEIDSYEQSRAQLKNGTLERETNTAEDLRSATSLLEAIYDNSRARVMKLLNLVQRSLRYETLSTEDFMEEAAQEQAHTSHDAVQEEAVLSMTCSYLSDMRNKLCSRLHDVREKQGSDATLFPRNFENDGIGKYHHLSRPQLQALLKTGEVRVSVPPIYQIVETEEQSRSDFRGCAAVRIYRVRFWLKGLKLKKQLQANGIAPLASRPPPSKGSAAASERNADKHDHRFAQSRLVSIKLVHSGPETLISPTGDEFKFSHDPIPVSFSYRIFADGSFDVDDTSSGDIVNFSSVSRSPESVYAAPGPFTEWKISLEDLNTDEIDINGVTEGKFEFFGTYRAFH